MNKNPLGTDRLKEQKLRTSTNHACFILNRCIFPIAQEIKMYINILSFARFCTKKSRPAA